MNPLQLGLIAREAARQFGASVTASVDGSQCRLTEQRGAFVNFDVTRSDLGMTIDDFGKSRIAPALEKLREIVAKAA